ncbi:hypothetical protein [Pendulispora albinea]|uniref:Uncharacterized protein n=1 Tax=Pendulispora albinea TaxID=2741071 RepID=A0ABZ2M930_9BACT
MRDTRGFRALFEGKLAIALQAFIEARLAECAACEKARFGVALAHPLSVAFSVRVAFPRA